MFLEAFEVERSKTKRLPLTPPVSPLGAE